MESLADRVNNSCDVVDSRDILERIKELKEDCHLFTPDYAGTESEPANSEQTWADANPDDASELAILVALVEEINQNAGDNAEDGVTLIRDTYFEDYAQELVQDIGDLPNGIPFYIVIDWEATADNIRQDCTAIEWDGVTYWLR